MTNTYFAPGDATPDDLIAGIERGLYAVSFGGGQVEPATGDFVFGVSEGYLIEGGKVTSPVRGATLIGNGSEALAAIDGIAGDLEIATGFCGKGGQRVPAGVGPAARAHQGAHRRGHRVSAGAGGRRARSRPRSRPAPPTPRRGRRSARALEVRVYEEAVESLTDAGGRGVGLRVFVDGRAGYAYGTDLSDAGCARSRSARTPARRPPTPTSTPACRSEFGAHAGRRPLTRQRSRTGAPSSKIELAIAVDRAAARARGRHAGRADGLRRRARARRRSRTRAASRRRTRPPRRGRTRSAFAGEGADLMTGLGVGLARDPGGLDPEAIGDEAAERALALVGARQPESRRCPVVLDAFVAASFVGFIGGMLSADAVQRGRSLFAGKLGEEVAALGVAARRRRHRPRRPGQRALRRRGLADAPQRR